MTVKIVKISCMNNYMKYSILDYMINFKTYLFRFFLSVTAISLMIMGTSVIGTVFPKGR